MEPKQREKLVITEAGHDLSLVFDFDPKHPKSHGTYEDGETWSRYTVKNSAGADLTLFAAGWLQNILPNLGIEKRGQKFSIKLVPYIGDDNKAKKAYQISFQGKTYDSRDGVKFNSKGEVADMQEVEFQDLENLRQHAKSESDGAVIMAKDMWKVSESHPVLQKGTTVPQSDPVAEKLDLLKRIMKGYIKLCKEVASEEGLMDFNDEGERGWLRLYDKTHISSAFINLSKN